MPESQPNTETLPQKLLRLRDYVRDEVRPAYVACGPSGVPALMLTIDPALKAADEALTTFDAVPMIRAVRELEGIKL